MHSALSWRIRSCASASKPGGHARLQILHVGLKVFNRATDAGLGRFNLIEIQKCLMKIMSLQHFEPVETLVHLLTEIFDLFRKSPQSLHDGGELRIALRSLEKVEGRGSDQQIEVYRFERLLGERARHAREIKRRAGDRGETLCLLGHFVVAREQRDAASEFSGSVY